MTCFPNSYTLSCCWTLTKKHENEIDVFQRLLIRKLMNVRWPHVISNDELYKRSNETTWTSKIKTRRLRWTGHLLRSPEVSPACKAFQESCRKSTNHKKTNRMTWKKQVDKDLQSINKDLSLEYVDLKNLAQDRVWWSRSIVGRSCAVPTIGVKH